MSENAFILFQLTINFEIRFCWRQNGYFFLMMRNNAKMRNWIQFVHIFASSSSVIFSSFLRKEKDKKIPFFASSHVLSLFFVLFPREKRKMWYAISNALRKHFSSSSSSSSEWDEERRESLFYMQTSNDHHKDPYS